MSKLSAKTQKGLLVSGLAVLCIVLAVALFSFVGGDGEKSKADIAENDTGTSVTVNDIKSNDKTEVTIPVTTEAPATTGSQVQGNENVVVDTEKRQNVEVPLTKPTEKLAEPEKPVVKDETETKNPDKPPVYDKQQTTVEPKSSEPKSGDKKDGKVYIPGFGWVKDEGGGSKSIKMGNDGDKLTGNKVGQMN